MTTSTVCSVLFTTVLPVDLGWIRPERSQHERTGREDRRLNFYNERGNLRVLGYHEVFHLLTIGAAAAQYVAVSIAVL